MRLKDIETLRLPATCDFHVHLREDEMMHVVTPTIRHGGVDTVFVMPNLQPPLITPFHVLEYKAQLQAIEPKVQYLMSLYLHPSITPSTIAEAAVAGITGVKLYPQGVTTNSESGVAADFLEAYADVFAAMERCDMTLNLHGEVHGTQTVNGVSLEEAFLPNLKVLHQRYPRLRIVLEHCSTAAALDAVRACGPSVIGTITAHHLFLTGDISHADPLSFCKPIPKSPSDRDALIRAACSGDGRFCLGSDSAPHPYASKVRSGNEGAVPAGVFTQPVVTQLFFLAIEEAIDRGVVDEKEVTQERLEQFLSRSGRRFYKLPDLAGEEHPRIVLERKGETIPKSIKCDTLEVGLPRSGASIFSLRWE